MDKYLSAPYIEFFEQMMKESAPYLEILFGQRIYEKLIKLYKSKNNLFSSSNIYAIEINEQPAGMLLGVESNKTSKLLNKTKRQLLISLGLKMTNYYKQFEKIFEQLPANSFVIMALRVASEFERYNVHRDLFNWAEMQARYLGCKKIIGLAATQNQFKIYDNYFYEVLQKIEISGLTEIVKITLFQKQL